MRNKNNDIRTVRTGLHLKRMCFLDSVTAPQKGNSRFCYISSFVSFCSRHIFLPKQTLFTTLKVSFLPLCILFFKFLTTIMQMSNFVLYFLQKKKSYKILFAYAGKSNLQVIVLMIITSLKNKPLDSKK